MTTPQSQTKPNTKPNTKSIAMYAIAAVATVFVIIVFAGIYKFNFTNDDIYIENSQQQVIAYNTLENLQLFNFQKQQDIKTVQQLQKIIHPEAIYKNAHYFLAKQDLNNDKQDEWMVSVEAAEVCGTGGCPFYVISSPNTAPKIALRFEPAQAIAYDDKMTKGWKNLYVTIGDGGSAPEIIEMHFDGKQYDFSPASAQRITHETEAAFTE